MPESQLYIGLMSGTSMDGIDAVLVDLKDEKTHLIEHHAHPIPSDLANELHLLCHSGENEINRLGEADIKVAKLFAEAVHTLLKNTGYSSNQIRAIGSHGQTVRHMPDTAHPFTLQIGDGNTLAVLTGIDVVADFRRKDMALGGQGAPLVPAFHQAVFATPKTDRVILNIGGISNLTYLPGAVNSSREVLGFDCGPGNTLMDHWCFRHTGQRYDANGQWASTGKVVQPLLSELLREPFFSLRAPKSTGRELFNLHWLDHYLSNYAKYSAEDIQATLLSLTAVSAARDISGICQNGELYVCGGGAHNTALMKALEQELPGYLVATTNVLGVDSDWVEAITFAWLAQRFTKRLPGNLPSVTGALRPAILGSYFTSH